MNCLKRAYKLAIVIALILMALMSQGCQSETSLSTTEKLVSIEILDKEETQLVYLEVETKQDVLSELLLEHDLIEYDETSLGKFITGMASHQADPRSEYWAIYVNGEYGLYGADNQRVTDGDKFLFRLEEY